MDCLKDLNASQNDLASKLTKVSDRLTTIEKENSSNSHQQLKPESELKPK